MNALIAPGHYLFSDKYGSEPLWSVELVHGLSKRVEHIDVIVGVSECNRIMPNNVNIINLFDKRSTSVFVELMRRSFFYILVTLKALRLMTTGRYSIIHHMLPFSLATFNPLLVITKLFLGSRLRIIGPIQSPYSSNWNDLDIALVGRKTNSVVLFFIQIIYYCLSSAIGLFSKLMIKSADHLIFTSKLSQAFYARYSNAPFSIMPPLVTTGSNNKDHQYFQTNRDILCAGSLVKRKGHKLLIQAMKNTSLSKFNCRLIILGDGPERTNLEGLATHLGLTNSVTFVGHLSRDKVMDYYEKAAVICLPSLEDSYPTVLIEAMAYGLPIVATDVGSCKEIVDKAGVIVPSSNSELLAEGIVKVLASEDAWRAYSKNGIRQYNNRYSEKVIVEKYLDVYLNLRK